MSNRNRADVKIQINSLEALERLIGGDTGLEVDLRASVVAAFTRRYLKDIVATEAIQQAKEDIETQIKNEAFRYIGAEYTNGKFGKYLKLSPAFLERVRIEAEHAVTEKVSAILSTMTDDLVANLLKHRDEVVNTAVSEVVSILEGKITKLAEKRVGEILAGTVDTQDKGVEMEGLLKESLRKEVFPDRIEWRNHNDKLHREDGPAVEYANGTKQWWFNGKRHREDGPAVEYTDGTKQWWFNGKLHREDGPAVEYANLSLIHI